jgi:hypothetical protein
LGDPTTGAEKEMDQRWKQEHPASKAKGISHTKGFRYPPVLPIVFFDGRGRWTAEKNFLYKTELHEVFERYIPTFEYLVINLNEYSYEELMGFADALSYVLMTDKVRQPEEAGALLTLPAGYREALIRDIPGHLSKVMNDAITMLLTHVGVTKEGIARVTDLIEERRYEKMFQLAEEEWAAVRREPVLLRERIMVLEQKYSTIERKYSTVEQEKSAIEQENAALKERLRQLEDR